VSAGFVVSVTRFRVRSLRFVPFFLIHAQRCLAQIRRADGYVAGSLRRDRDHSYWTTSVWRDDAALLAYVTGGAHRNAMPKMSEWGDEASTVRWVQRGAELPSWQEAIERMRSEGRPVPLLHPGPGHAALGFAASEPSQMSRI
jgi:quinol monooxygenase YgiN